MVSNPLSPYARFVLSRQVGPWREALERWFRGDQTPQAVPLPEDTHA